jgi:hypothetical protein
MFVPPETEAHLAELRHRASRTEGSGP